VTVKEGEKANLTLFCPGEEWTMTEKQVHSLSKNTPFTGKKLKGKVTGIINNDRYQAAEA
jgi:dihydroorotase